MGAAGAALVLGGIAKSRQQSRQGQQGQQQPQFGALQTALFQQIIQSILNRRKTDPVSQGGPLGGTKIGGRTIL